MENLYVKLVAYRSGYLKGTCVRSLLKTHRLVFICLMRQLLRHNLSNQSSLKRRVIILPLFYLASPLGRWGDRAKSRKIYRSIDLLDFWDLSEEGEYLLPE